MNDLATHDTVPRRGPRGAAGGVAGAVVVGNAGTGAGEPRRKQRLTRLPALRRSA